jgi:rubrerythrin
MTLRNFGMLEAVEVALNMEREGIRFYTLAESRVADPEMKKLFAFLREKEHQHVAYFQGVYTRLAEREGDRDAALWLLDQETADYFRAAAESAVFPVKGAADQAIAGLHDARDILRLGLRVEKDSIHFYRELQQHAPWPDAKELLDKVIAEERRHFRLIHEKLVALDERG